MSFVRGFRFRQSGLLICNVNGLTGFYILQVFIERDSEKTFWSVCEYLLVKKAPINWKPVNRFAIQIVPVFGERYFCTYYD